jgi:hypothetical protein|tara:strand:+ start:230 stop:376 length:147 start_codon:yes stop_codon:yes gene_type:complete
MTLITLLIKDRGAQHNIIRKQYRAQAEEVSGWRVWSGAVSAEAKKNTE